MTKVYLRGGPRNTHLQDVADDATPWTHLSLRGESEASYRETLMWLANPERSPSAHATVTLRAEDIVRSVYAPNGDWIERAGVAYPVWECQP